ncbi:MAG TPA: hypothetical protein VES62_07385 [Thermoleophilaceae bacterium]|nr:hypothetical protein [Thermoleophilaceae bacterium]
MAELVQERTMDAAWRTAVARLRALGDECYDLLVEIEDPSTTSAHGEVSRRVDAVLAARGQDGVSTVANTIFPAALAASSRDRTTLYRRYEAILPILRRDRKNKKGMYFERLIRYPLQDDPERMNQLELTISNLQRQLATRQPRRHAYELQVFGPGKDRLPMGFPCMSSLSVHIDSGNLRLAATYRNQYYVRKALGNFLGLSRLQGWIAHEVGLPVGALSVHAFHAEIDPDLRTHAVQRALGV